MRKFAGKLLLFALFFALLFTLTNFCFLGLLENTEVNFKKILQSLKFDNPDFELLVLGTSFAEYGIDTELITSEGIKSFNLALEGASFKTSYFQLNNYLSKYSKRPRYVLLVFNTAKELIHSDDIHPIIDFTREDYKFVLKDAPIFKFKWLGTELIKKLLSSKHRKARLSYGQVKFTKSTSDNTDFNELYLNVKGIESLQWIGEIAHLCDQNEIEMIIIGLPGFKETQNLSETGPYKLHFNNGCSALFYNFNTRDFCTIFDSDKDWIGNSHLNEIGAKKFTKELTGVLKK
jgi:hypothetical protein